MNFPNDVATQINLASFIYKKMNRPTALPALTEIVEEVGRSLRYPQLVIAIPEFLNSGISGLLYTPEFWQPEFRNFGNEIMGCRFGKSI